jgi:hypothetical protein
MTFFKTAGFRTSPGRFFNNRAVGRAASLRFFGRVVDCKPSVIESSTKSRFLQPHPRLRSVYKVDFCYKYTIYRSHLLFLRQPWQYHLQCSDPETPCSLSVHIHKIDRSLKRFCATCPTFISQGYQQCLIVSCPYCYVVKFYGAFLLHSTSFSATLRHATTSATPRCACAQEWISAKTLYSPKMGNYGREKLTGDCERNASLDFGLGRVRSPLAEPYAQTGRVMEGIPVV